MRPEQAAEILQKREEMIRKMLSDPFYHGYEPPTWKTADEQFKHVDELLVLGGNRAGKSKYAASRIIKKLVEKPKSMAWCFHTTENSSVQSQQPYLWEYIPSEFKGLKKGQITNITYSQKGGFTENSFVLPNGSQCWFKNYAQDIQIVEGVELDAIWCDELVTPEWLETLRYRVVTRNGIMLVTFTPIQGYTSTVKLYLNGAKTLEEVDAELLPQLDADKKVIGYEKVPRIQKGGRTNTRIVYFHTKDNPFAGYERIKKELVGASRETILMRAYGIPTKAIANRFPRFKDQVHVIADSKVPQTGTRYQFIDPCSGRNWFMLWVIVDPKGRWTIYREWPTPHDYVPGVGRMGTWAQPDGKKHDGKKGPAQDSLGWGLEQYKREIERLERMNSEKSEVIFERFMDSRYGATPTLGKETATTLIDECANLGLFFRATSGKEIDEGIDLINDRLFYDSNLPISSTNEPRLFISEKCENTIYALKEWTGLDGRHGASKDPIDLIRYMALAEIDYLEGEILNVKKGRCY
jgi:hypothetical protein